MYRGTDYSRAKKKTHTLSNAHGLNLGSNKIGFQRAEVTRSLSALSIGKLEDLAKKSTGDHEEIISILSRKYRKNGIMAAKVAIDNLSRRGGKLGDYAKAALEEINAYDNNQPEIKLEGKYVADLDSLKRKLKGEPKLTQPAKKQSSKRR